MKAIPQKKDSGFSLIETIFYIALFVVVALVVVNALISMTKSFRATSIQADFVQSSSIIERISRDIRQSYDIYAISSSDVTLNTKDEAGNNKTIRFLLSGSDVQIFENGILIGNLNSSTIQVTSLSFTQINTLVGKAVKVYISVTSTKDASSRVESFYSTVVLRGSYY